MPCSAVFAGRQHAARGTSDSFCPVPRAGNSFWRDSVPQAMRSDYICYGEQYLGYEWSVLPVTLFAEFRQNGNRTRYETACFERRRRLAALAMAEIIEGEGRFMNDIINGLGSLCEELWWGIPAHYGKNMPCYEEQTVDLFNAETAGMAAWINYMLSEQLDRQLPGLSNRIAGEIERRVLRPALANGYWWKTAGMNWNPWICSNWLTCILLCEDNSERKAEGIAQVKKAMQAFVDAYPADGGCDEGTGYWDRAAASLFECMRLLNLAEIDGECRFTPKIHNMMSYIYKMYIGNGYCVNFADAHSNRMQAQPDILLPMALYMKDEIMKGFAAYIARGYGLFDNPAKLYGNSGNFPALGRELLMLRQINEAARLIPAEPNVKNVWLPDLQIMTSRKDSLYIAVKGGTNGENHNHNDVGNFIVYAGGKPLIIDAGTGEYTSKTFGPERYSIWTMQSGYHNLPQINGTDQHDGVKYSARLIEHRNGRITFDIAGAYPPEAYVTSWLRTVAVGKGKVLITEKYELDRHIQPVRLMLMTPVKPDAGKPGVIRLGDHRVEYPSGVVSVDIEDISNMTDRLLREVWGSSMYRIVMTLTTGARSGKIEYCIR